MRHLIRFASFAFMALLALNAQAAVPDISISDVTASEGNAGTTNFTFTVSLSAAPAGTPTSVDWATANGTALAGSDYAAGTGTLTWAIGDGASKSITVQVWGDSTAEANETFFVNLSNASSANILDAQGLGTITNDDLAPPDLTLTKSDGGASTVPGATVGYTLGFANASGQAASGVIITETVPSNTVFNPGASTAGWACAPNNYAGSTCTYTVGGLAVSASGNTTFAVTVDSPLTLGVVEVSNTASIADDGARGADPNPANNSAIDRTPIEVPPVMGNVPDQSGTVGVGFSLALAGFVTLTNGDPTTGYAIATGSLPPGLTLNAGTGVISGSPTTAGTYVFKVGASDNDGNSNADVIQFVVAEPPATPAIPTISVSPTCGLVTSPPIVNLAAGEGPTLMPDLVTMLSSALGVPLRYVEQTICGAVVLAGYNDGNLAFIPFAFQAGDGRSNGIYPVGNGQYHLVRNGQRLTLAPALVHLEQLVAMLPSLTASQSESGAILATFNGVRYSVQPGVAVQLGAAGGAALLTMGDDGHFRFRDNSGNTQILYPAFADPATLRTTLQSLYPAATLSVALDATAKAVIGSQSYTLVPDLTVVDIPSVRVGQYQWQERENRYWIVNAQPTGSTQGLTVKQP